jgi:hypothetical protein
MSLHQERLVVFAATEARLVAELFEQNGLHN